LTLVRDKKLRLDDLAVRLLQDGALLAPGQSADRNELIGVGGDLDRRCKGRRDDNLLT
jgi:hypothetical protein